MSARTADVDAAGERSGQLGDRASRARLRQALLPWLFLAPALLLLVLFTFWPVLWGSYLAFTEYNFLTPPKWAGLANFEDLLDDPVFFISLKNSLLYLLIVPAIQLGAIALAVLVNNSLPGIKAFRAAFYIPVVTSVSVVGIMWGWMYNEQGLINAVLQTLHVINDPIGWLSDDRLALFSLMLVTLWRGLGWYMVLYLAALQAMSARIPTNSPCIARTSAVICSRFLSRRDSVEARSVGSLSTRLIGSGMCAL
jgi:putative chitobiose transport system permease protein